MAKKKAVKTSKEKTSKGKTSRGTKSKGTTSPTRKISSSGPARPAQAAGKAKPLRSAKSTTVAKPTTSGKPAKPGKPTTSGKPATSGKSAKRGKATKSVKPASSAKAPAHTMVYQPRPAGNTTSKTRRGFGDPVALVKPQPSFVSIPSTNKMPASLSYDLSDAVDAALIQAMEADGRMVFHCVGDTGDINGTGNARDLALQMEAQYTTTAGSLQPAFFYHLGDVVYYNGVSTDYAEQFYDVYKFYPPVIMAIPGNHDGQTIVNKGDPPDPEPSLKGFITNFCDSKRNPSPSSPYRYTMDQPWPYWVLNTPMATFIGLYSNVDGSLDDWNDTIHPQYGWLVDQLKSADKKKALILAVHHSPFSLDGEHGGYPDILDALDQASAAAGGRYPDLVLSGHVHNYQRFHRLVGNVPVVHIVAGNGGYASVKTMHQMQKDPSTGQQLKASPAAPFHTTKTGVTLMNYQDTLPGFLRITIDRQFLTGEYFLNDLTGGTQSTVAFDTFVFDYVTKRLQ